MSAALAHSAGAPARGLTPPLSSRDDSDLEREVHERVVAGATAPERDSIAHLVRALDPLRPAVSVSSIVDRVIARVVGLGPLQALVADPDVTEVMVNGPGAVWIERRGALVRTDLELDGRAIDQVIERIVAPLGLRLDRSAPLVDARLPDGSRVNAVVPPLAVDGPYLTIRRFAVRGVTLDDIAAPPLAALLRWAVIGRFNIVITGGAGAGKTTLLNALAAQIPRGERIVTVEDAAELRLPSDHVVRLEARPGNADGVGAVTIRDLVRNALRMRPDRIVVGECRGAEALDMVQAMTTGHDGSMSTCHASNASDAMRRLETMVLLGDVALPMPAVREQVASAIDLVVHVARRSGGERRVVAIAEADLSSTGVWRLRPLADENRVIALPQQPPRWHAAPAADPRWVTALAEHGHDVGDAR